MVRKYLKKKTPWYAAALLSIGLVGGISTTDYGKKAVYPLAEIGVKGLGFLGFFANSFTEIENIWNCGDTWEERLDHVRKDLRGTAFSKIPGLEYDEHRNMCFCYGFFDQDSVDGISDELKRELENRFIDNAEEFMDKHPFHTAGISAMLYATLLGSLYGAGKGVKRIRKRYQK